MSLDLARGLTAWSGTGKMPQQEQEGEELKVTGVPLNIPRSGDVSDWLEFWQDTSVGIGGKRLKVRGLSRESWIRSGVRSGKI